MATTGAVCPHPKGLQLVREGEARLSAAAAVPSGSRGNVAWRPQPSSVVASGVSKRCRLDRVHRDNLSKTPPDEGKRRAGTAAAVKGWRLEYARRGGSCGGGGGRGVQLQSSFWGSSWSCCFPCSFSQLGRVSTRSQSINPSPFPSYCKGQCFGTGSLRSAVRPHCYVQSYSQKVSLDLSAKPCRRGLSSSIAQDSQRHSQRRGDRVLARVVSSASGERQLLNADDYLPREFARSSAGIELLELERGVCNPFKKYSPEGVRARAFESPGAALAVIARGLKIVCSLGLYWANVSLDVLFGRDMEMVPYRAEQLRNLLVDLGPSFIKSGQVLANRPDIIRADYMEELCILQDDVPAFPSDIAFRMIEEDLGRPLQSVFSKISKIPVAAASLGQVYRGTLAKTGEEIAIKVQRPGIEPIIYRDLFLFRMLASFVNGYCLKKLGCNGELIVDEFAEKLLEELDYKQEARNIEDFYRNFEGDPTVKIPRVYKELSSSRVLVMEWIDGIRCTDPQAIWESGIDVNAFITIGVSSGLRQLLEFGLFHGDPHPGNIFAMRDGRIAYVDFGNVAELSQYNKQILIDAIVHAVNEDYVEMARDFTRLGFLAPGTDIAPIVPALEKIWQNSLGKGLADFNFRTVTGKFNELVYQYPIRIPERFSLVIRSLLTQEGICLTLQPDFKFLEVAYPYIAKRLLTDPDPALRERLLQVLFKNGVFQWKRLENLISLAKEQVDLVNKTVRTRERAELENRSARSGDLTKVNGSSSRGSGLDLKDTIKDGTRVMLVDRELRRQLLLALTQDSRLHVQEVRDIYRLVAEDVQPQVIIREIVGGIPEVAKELILSWSDSVLAER